MIQYLKNKKRDRLWNACVEQDVAKIQKLMKPGFFNLDITMDYQGIFNRMLYRHEKTALRCLFQNGAQHIDVKHITDEMVYLDTSFIIEVVHAVEHQHDYQTWVKSSGIAMCCLKGAQDEVVRLMEKYHDFFKQEDYEYFLQSVIASGNIGFIQFFKDTYGLTFKSDINYMNAIFANPRMKDSAKIEMLSFLLNDNDIRGGTYFYQHLNDLLVNAIQKNDDRIAGYLLTHESACLDFSNCVFILEWLAWDQTGYGFMNHDRWDRYVDDLGGNYETLHQLLTHKKYFNIEGHRYNLDWAIEHKHTFLVYLMMIHLKNHQPFMYFERLEEVVHYFEMNYGDHFINPLKEYEVITQSVTEEIDIVM